MRPRIRTQFPPDDEWFPRWLGPTLVALAFVTLAWWSWRKWPDLIIDFGNQLYLPWQLARGKTLYADLVYKEGPLSQYVNALLFRVFGTSLTTLIWANLLLFAVLVTLVYRLFAGACDRFTATLAALVFVTIFGFSQYTPAGNYNYICPYTHEQTHGLLLGIAMITALGAYLRTRRPGWVVTAGGLFGLVFLTKLELFVPTAGAAAVGLTVASTAPGARRLRSVLLFGASALVPPLVFFFGLIAVVPAGTALRGILSNWPFLFATPDEPFYIAMMLGDAPGANLVVMVKMFLGLVAVVAVAAAADWSLRSITWARRIVVPALAAGLAAFLLYSPDRVPWATIGRPLPLTSLVLAIFLIWMCLHRGNDHATRARLAPLAMWAVFASLLLVKVALQVRLSHYGFVLAMPATLLLVATLVWLVPSWLRHRWSGGEVARALLVAFIVAGTVFYLRWSHRMLAQKDTPVGTGGDRIVAENPIYRDRTAVLAMAEARLRQLMPSTATLVAMPEGILLNYLLRRDNPTRYQAIPPQLLRFFGEKAVLEDLAAHPPDFIALIHRESREFNVGYFGVDPNNGRQIMEWVTRHYQRIERIGAEPFRDRTFGIVLLRRIDAAGD